MLPQIPRHIRYRNLVIPPAHHPQPTFYHPHSALYVVIPSLLGFAFCLRLSGCPILNVFCEGWGFSLPPCSHPYPTECGGSMPLCLSLLHRCLSLSFRQPSQTQSLVIPSRQATRDLLFALPFAGCPILFTLTQEGSVLFEGWGFCLGLPPELALLCPPAPPRLMSYRGATRRGLPAAGRDASASCSALRPSLYSLPFSLSYASPFRVPHPERSLRRVGFLPWPGARPTSAPAGHLPLSSRGAARRGLPAAGRDLLLPFVFVLLFVPALSGSPHARPSSFLTHH